MNDEKSVPYRKDPRSDTSIDQEEPPSSSDNEDGSATATEDPEPVTDPHAQVKELFVGLLDSQPKVAASFIAFSWTAPNDCQLTFKAVEPIINQQ